MLSPTNTPSPTDEDRELIERARKLREECRVGVEEHGIATNYVSACLELRHYAPKLLDLCESLLSDRAKLEEIVAVANELVNGGGLQLRSGNVPRLTVVETSDKSDPHYRLCTLLDALNRSTDRAT